MRVVIIFLLLIILGFIAWKAAERFNLIERAPQAGEAPQAPGAPARDEKPAAALPSFDIVRVDRSGEAVIAGRASSGATVTVYANDAPLATTTAGADGSWVMTTETPLEAGAVELSLDMKTTDGAVIRSDETIVIYVPERAGDRPLVLKTTPGGATQVLQEPREDGVSFGPLSLDTIDYDQSGAVIFSGRAEAGRVVQIFANDQFVGQTAATADGRWRFVTSLPPGGYTLQIIQLDENGKPTYAIELPFERANLDDIELKDGKVIVQPGNSLWRIARRIYGKGVQYTIIYEANADQIRDPDLIYPGQIFEIPEAEEQNAPG